MKVYDPDGLRVFFGPNSQHFKEGTLKALSQKFDYPIKAGRYDPIEFSDGEMKVQLLESNRGRTAFLVMSTEVLGGDHRNLFWALQCIRDLKDAKTKPYLFAPYMSYSRQDKKAERGTTITFRLILDLLEAAGLEGLITMDLHAESEQGFVDVRKIASDRVYASYELIPAIQKILPPDNVFFISPDSGGMKRAKMYGDALGFPDNACFGKVRTGTNYVEQIRLLADSEFKAALKGATVVMVDDMIDTFGTGKEGTFILAELGVARIIFVVPHPVLSGKAPKNIRESAITEMVFTDSVYHSPKELALFGKKIQIVPLGEFIGDIIGNVYCNESISHKFIDSKTFIKV